MSVLLFGFTPADYTLRQLRRNYLLQATSEFAADFLAYSSNGRGPASIPLTLA
jgi:hypothetical protein